MFSVGIYHGHIQSRANQRPCESDRKITVCRTEETAPERLETFEGIEQAIRSHILNHVGPEIGEFFVKQQAAAEPGAAVRLKASLETSKSPKPKHSS